MAKIRVHNLFQQNGSENKIYVSKQIFYLGSHFNLPQKNLQTSTCKSGPFGLLNRSLGKDIETFISPFSITELLLSMLKTMVTYLQNYMPFAHLHKSLMQFLVPSHWTLLSI